MGFALFAAYPRRSTVLWGVAMIALSFAIWPTWAAEWLHSVATDTPHLPHLLRPGGFLLLLGLLRWRRPEGRLLAALCIIPQTTALYETLPVALVVRDRRQAAVYATLTMIAHLLFKLGPQGPWPVGAEYQWWVMLLLVYLPALALVLKRPNGPANAGLAVSGAGAEHLTAPSQLPPSRPDRMDRPAAGWSAAGAAVFVAYRLPPPTNSDLDQVLEGARALLHGQDPYGSAERAHFFFPQLYPLTALLLLVPLTPFPSSWRGSPGPLPEVRH